MRKIKLFYLITGLTAGGAEIMLKRIISRLNLRKFDIIICSITQELDLFNDLKPFIKSLYCLDVKSVLNGPKSLVQLRKILLQEDPDILHCFMPHANILGRFASLGLKMKVISSLWVVLLKKKYLTIIDIITQKLVDIYTVNSYSLKHFVTRFGLKSKKIEVIESGIDPESFIISRDIAELRKELNLTKKPILTMVAHLRKQKDYPTMIKAIALLQNKMDFTFLSCGYGNKFEDETIKIKKLIKKLNLNNVKLLGFRNDVTEILALTDLWVSSTLYEGQSNSLLEAMAMKKAIITTDIPENAEVVRDGKEAFLVPIKSPGIMAEKINFLINNNDIARRLSKNAYTRVKKNYHINKTVEKIEKLYSFGYKKK